MMDLVNRVLLCSLRGSQQGHQYFFILFHNITLLFIYWIILYNLKTYMWHICDEPKNIYVMNQMRCINIVVQWKYKVVKIVPECLSKCTVVLFQHWQEYIFFFNLHFLQTFKGEICFYHMHPVRERQKRNEQGHFHKTKVFVGLSQLFSFQPQRGY